MRNKHVIEDEEDDTTPPAYDDDEEYKATKMLRVGRMALELWFVKADGKGEQIFPLADMRRMEPPSDPQKEVAYMYFSGVRVELHGSHLRQVLKDICTHRCTELHEIRPGQKRPPAGQPVIERIYFGDLTRAKPVAADALN
jgi:hypothetical protein